MNGADRKYLEMAAEPGDAAHRGLEKEDEAAQVLANVTESQVRDMLGHLAEETTQPASRTS